MELKQYAAFVCCEDFSVFSSVPDGLRKWLKELVYLVVPEDTTDKTTGREIKSIIPAAGNTRSSIKVACWIAFAITMSLCIGQLN